VSPIVQNGVTVGYGSVRVKASEGQIEQATQLYKRINAGQLRGYRLAAGQLKPLGVRAWLKRLQIWRADTLRARVVMLMSSALLGFLVVGGMGVYAAYTDAANAPWLVPTIGVASLLGVCWLSAVSLALVRSVARPLQGAVTFSRQIGAGNLAARLAK